MFCSSTREMFRNGMTVRDLLWSMISDDYKSLHGVRPRFADPSSMTLVELHRWYKAINDQVQWDDPFDPMEFERERMWDEICERQNSPQGTHVKAVATATRRAGNCIGAYYLTHGSDSCDKRSKRKAGRALSKAYVLEGLEEL